MPITFDPHDNEIQYLEDLATSYRQAEVLYTGLEISLFDYLIETKTIEELSKLYNCASSVLQVLLDILVDMGLLTVYQGNYLNSSIGQNYLVSSSSKYMGEVILYKKNERDQWANLKSMILKGVNAQEILEDDFIAYDICNIEKIFSNVNLKGSVLNIGNKRAKYRQALVKMFKCFVDTYTFDDIEDIVLEKKYEVIMLNQLNSNRNKLDIIRESIKHLDDKGYIVIHDYFIDNSSLMVKYEELNHIIHNSKLDSAQWYIEELSQLNLKTIQVSLQSGREVLISAKDNSVLEALSINEEERLVNNIKEIGFRDITKISAKDIVLSQAALLKCQYGCDYYHKGTCYQNIDIAKTQAILADYKDILLIEGQPPTRDFQTKLLKVEKTAFMAGYYKALVFWAGPCNLCKECIKDKENCSKTRPSMENYGIDVFATVIKKGIKLKTVKKDDHVKYFSLLFLN